MASPRVRLALALCSTLAACAAGEWIVRRGGATPWTPMLENAGETGQHEFDPVRGWRNKEGVYPRRRPIPREPPTCVTMWPGGRRATALAQRASERRVVVLGCSWTQGWAISDDETYAWRLQERFPDAEFFNYGTAGYGTLQCLLALEEHYERVGSAEVVLFGLSSVQQERNLAEASWLSTIALGATRQHVWAPWVEVDARGELVRHPPARYPAFPGHESSALIALLERRYAEWRHPDQPEVRVDATWKLVLELRRCAEAHGSTFVVAALGWSPTIRIYHARLEQAAIPFVDCDPPYQQRLFVRGDGHPNGAMHGIWADWITPLVGEVLRDGRSGAAVRGGDAVGAAARERAYR